MLMALLMACLSSCSDDEERLSAVPYAVLDTIVSTQDITFDAALHDVAEQMGLGDEDLAPYRQRLNMAAMRSRVYHAHVITYHSSDPDGKPVIVSGVVYYPKSGKPRGVIEALSYNKNKMDYPSANIANLELLQGMAGYIVIVSDQIGCGVTDTMVVPYFNHDNTVRVNADLRRAATELVRNEYGRSMPSWTLISGFSFAASEAWALARYYHQHPELGVEVAQVWLSGGAYHPVAVFQEQLRSRHADYAFIPNAIYSVNHYGHLGLDLHQVFRGELREHYEEWCTGRMALRQLTERLGTDVGQYLNLDFFRDDNDDYRRLMDCMRRMDIPDDWVPTCNVHLYHARDDSYVPVGCSDTLAAYLRSVGVDVDYVVTDGGHLDNGIQMASHLAEMLYK